ncbi:MAG: hypothetical protein WBG38_07635 [Nodosilinea sp.]
MGLIKSIFGAIFGLIGGIFKTVGGLVGLGKKSEFFLELIEDDNQPAIAPSAPAPVAKAEAPAAPTASETPAKAAKASKKKATKSPAKAAAKGSVEETPTPAPAPAPKEPVATAFASKYLTTVGTALPRRRRPGPSLSPFMDMAKQVKVR